MCRPILTHGDSMRRFYMVACVLAVFAAGYLSGKPRVTTRTVDGCPDVPDVIEVGYPGDESVTDKVAGLQVVPLKVCRFVEHGEFHDVNVMDGGPVWWRVKIGARTYYGSPKTANRPAPVTVANN